MPLDALQFEKPDYEKMQAVRDLLVRDGWCSHGWEDQDGRRCFLWAMAVVWGIKVRDIQTLQQSIGATQVVMKAIREVSGVSFADIPQYNDYIGRTLPDVLRVIDRTIQLMEHPSYVSPQPQVVDPFLLISSRQKEKPRSLARALANAALFIVTFVTMPI